MKKTWIILTLLTLVSYTSISQTDITDSVICLPVDWARQTIIELEERDMFEEQIGVLNEEIHLRDKKIDLIAKKQKKAKFQRNMIGIASAILTVLTRLTR